MQDSGLGFATWFSTKANVLVRLWSVQLYHFLPPSLPLPPPLSLSLSSYSSSSGAREPSRPSRGAAPYPLFLSFSLSFFLSFMRAMRRPDPSLSLSLAPSLKLRMLTLNKQALSTTGGHPHNKIMQRSPEPMLSRKSEANLKGRQPAAKCL